MKKKINKKYLIIGSCILAVCLFFIIFGIVYSSINKTEKYSITYVSEHGTKPEDVAEATALPEELPTVADVEGWHFVGWYTTEDFAEGSEATAGVALTANITLYAKWIPLDDFILSAQKEFEDYINQKKSNCSAEYALDALDQVYTDHEHDFDELTTCVEVSEKLQDLKDMVDALVESNISITYINGDEEETIKYSFGEEIDEKIQVGEPDEKFAWYEENATEKFDFSNVSPNQSYTLYGKWHDIITKINDIKIYKFSTYHTLPETDPNDPLIEYSFDGETFLDGTGIVTCNGSDENSYIKINLPSKGRIFVEQKNPTEDQPVVFIDTTPNMTNTNSSYGSVTLKPGSTSWTGYSWDRLVSCELEAGTYYVNWLGAGLQLVNLEVFYEVEKEIEFTDITGELWELEYRQGYYHGSLDLHGLFLNTTDGEPINIQSVISGDVDSWWILYWAFIRDKFIIDIENEEEFRQGRPEIGRTFDVTVTYGKHTQPFSFTVTIIDP